MSLSCSNLSHRARFGALLGGILFLSGVFLYQVAPPHLEDFSLTPSHSPPPQPAPPHSPPPHSPPPQSADLVLGGAHSPPSYGTLETRLSYQEKLYQEYLEDRKGLIKKWGPTPDKVKTFQNDGWFYTLWDFFIPQFSCPFPVRRIGTLGDGGKFVCGVERVLHRPDCVIYSLGVNDESSFEAALLSRSSTCRMYGYDFSVKSWANQVSSHPEWSDRVEFKPWKIMPDDNHNRNPEEHTIQSLFDTNGHKFVDILKVDIEGAEYTAMESLIRAYKEKNLPLPFGQLLIELHVWGEWDNFEKFKGWWELLEEAGLRPFWTEPNIPHAAFVHPPNVAEWSFINTRGQHALISDLY